MNFGDFVEIFLIGVGLSMDAFAVAACRGLEMRERIRVSHMFVIALFFGGFQALMPLIGWWLTKKFEQSEILNIEAYDHWVAFVLLLFIGGKMLVDVLRESKCGQATSADGAADSAPTEEKLNLPELFVMAIATSIDALATGVIFATENSVRIAPAITIIGLTTFALAIVGVLVGHRFGTKYQKKATIAGGVILIVIGTKILLEGVGLLNL